MIARSRRRRWSGKHHSDGSKKLALIESLRNASG
jgi:hypothetical protein